MKTISSYVRASLNTIELRATHNEREMYTILKREFPEVVDLVLMYDGDGIGLAYAPDHKNRRWKSLEEMYLHFLPEINSRYEYNAYLRELNEFINASRS